MEKLRQEYRDVLESNRTREVAYENWQINERKIVRKIVPLLACLALALKF